MLPARDRDARRPRRPRATFGWSGAIVNVHGAPACVTLNVWPAIVTDPVRCAVPVFAATVTLTVPLPVPPEPTVTSHAALLVAVHAQVLPVVTATATLSPPAGEVRLVGAIVNVHGAPACVTLNVWPAIVTDPVRCAVAGIGGDSDVDGAVAGAAGPDGQPRGVARRASTRTCCPSLPRRATLSPARATCGWSARSCTCTARRPA